MEDFESSSLGRVTVYSIQGCPHCVQAKATLGGLGVPVCDVDVGKHPELRARVKELTGRSSVPQIFFNNIHVGGNDDLQKMAPEELQRLVNVVRKEPLPADAPPLPEENPTESTSGETDGEFVCERDELADLVENFKHGNVIGSHRKGLTVHKKSFSSDQLVDWLHKEKGMARAEACSTGQAMMQKKYMVSVRGCGEKEGCFGEGRDALYRLLEHDPHSALNTGRMAACIPIPEANSQTTLNTELILKLFSEHLSADGKSVDYKGMSGDPAFERYCELAIQLQRVELLSLSREEKLAFFINIYNALVIHGNLRLGAPTNMLQRYKFFNYVSYLIGGELFTLQDIENGVLRGNRRGMAQLLRPFSKTDPRLQVALPDAEPLIHFALNCGAKGCPPIKTYTPKDIDSQLRTAAEAFLENDDSCLVDSGKREVRLSQIFKWYKADFGGTDEKLLKWVLDHMGDSPKKSSLQDVISAGKTKVIFLPYDWSTNGTH
ncbi:Glutaredoxin 1 [Dissostichus eleginoides]|uniref:Glutaredoxin 1 n=1 Tax=Dissostichus eleginoides TaxID=100907 RepID=A0AAD9FHW4_DISEL|nr:Glutaredoxin 1 [Dissostichus eleginoides]